MKTKRVRLFARGSISLEFKADKKAKAEQALCSKDRSAFVIKTAYHCYKVSKTVVFLFPAKRKQKHS